MKKDNFKLIVTTSWDDGSALDLKLAELLDKYEMQGTFYIPQSYLENSLQKDDLKELDRRFEIGAHTLNHVVLTEIPLEHARNEIEGSKKWLEELLGHNIDMFCYPKGRFNSDIKRLVYKAGFKAARTCYYGNLNFPADPYEWQITLHASNGSPLQTFKTYLKSGISIKSLLDWEIRAKLLFDLALKSGGIYHLWGHSWEIAKNDEWSKLERVLSYISNKANVIYSTNGNTYLLHTNKNLKPISKDLYKHLNIFKCPDDGAPLVLEDKHLYCEKCRRNFPCLKKNVFEILPSRPYISQSNDTKYYVNLLQEKFQWNPLAKPWGDISKSIPGTRAYVKKEINLIEKHLSENISNGTLLDVSGGSGVYSLVYSNKAKLTVHNDLSIDSINYVYSQTSSDNLENVLIIRSDYYQLPFAPNTFDAIICTGHTLNKGDIPRVLKEIMTCLKPSGKFAVDFSNRSRHTPILKTTNNQTISYRKSELPVPKGVISIKIECIGYVPIRLVLFEKIYPYLDFICKIIGMPASTYLVIGQKE